MHNSCILTCISHMDLRSYFHWIASMRVVFRISYKKDCIDIWKGMNIYASHVVAYLVFSFRKKCTWHCLLGVHIYFHC